MSAVESAGGSPPHRPGPLLQATKLQPPRWRTSSVRRPRLTGLLRARPPGADPDRRAARLRQDVAAGGLGRHRRAAIRVGHGRAGGQRPGCPLVVLGAALGNALGDERPLVDRASSRPPVTRPGGGRLAGSWRPCPRRSSSSSTMPSACAATSPRRPDPVRRAGAAHRPARDLDPDRPAVPRGPPPGDRRALELRAADLAFTPEETTELLVDASRWTSIPRRSTSSTSGPRAGRPACTSPISRCGRRPTARRSSRRSARRTATSSTT